MRFPERAADGRSRNFLLKYQSLGLSDNIQRYLVWGVSQKIEFFKHEIAFSRLDYTPVTSRAVDVKWLR
jgi:hypothetical protein